jgi:hypothetical protein
MAQSVTETHGTGQEARRLRTMIDSELVESYLPHLTRTEGFVYLVLATRRDWDTKLCWPHQRTIAALVGCSESQVRRALDKLVKLALLAVRRTRSGNEYELLEVPFRPRTHTRSDRASMRGSNRAPMRGVKEREPVNEIKGTSTRPQAPPRGGASAPSLSLVPDPREAAYKADRRKQRLDNWEATAEVMAAVDNAFIAAGRPASPWDGHRRSELRKLLREFPEFELDYWVAVYGPSRPAAAPRKKLPC